MVIINKKRIQIIISALLVGIFTFSLQIANNNQKGEKNKFKNNTKSTKFIRTKWV